MKSPLCLTTLRLITALKALCYAAAKKAHSLQVLILLCLAACETAEDAEALSKGGQDVFNRIENMNKTFVAAIHGPALGGGLELALACHYRVCSDSDITQLGLPEVQLGLLPGSGGTQRLPRLIGIQQAMKMMLTGFASAC